MFELSTGVYAARQSHLTTENIHQAPVVRRYNRILLKTGAVSRADEEHKSSFSLHTILASTEISISTHGSDISWSLSCVWIDFDLCSCVTPRELLACPSLRPQAGNGKHPNTCRSMFSTIRNDLENHIGSDTQLHQILHNTCCQRCSARHSGRRWPVY